MIGRKSMVGMLFFLTAPLLQAGWSVGVSFAAPYHHHHRHCYGPPPCYYRPYPIYVRPAPVFVQPVTVLEPVAATYPAPVEAVRPSVVAKVVGGSREEDIERYQRQ